MVSLQGDGAARLGAGSGRLPVGKIARNALSSDPVAHLIINGHMNAFTPNDSAIFTNQAVNHISAIRILEG